MEVDSILSVDPGSRENRLFSMEIGGPFWSFDILLEIYHFSDNILLNISHFSFFLLSENSGPDSMNPDP
jgi:hypothetical protein